MANTSIFAAFERMWQHTVAALNNKSDISHTHNIEEGGTGANNAADARANLGIKSAYEYAIEGGYEGTEEEFSAALANVLSLSSAEGVSF